MATGLDRPERYVLADPHHLLEAFHTSSLPSRRRVSQSRPRWGVSMLLAT